jgi:hypothetical protein
MQGYALAERLYEIDLATEDLIETIVLAELRILTTLEEVA